MSHLAVLAIAAAGFAAVAAFIELCDRLTRTPAAAERAASALAGAAAPNRVAAPKGERR